MRALKDMFFKGELKISQDSLKSDSQDVNVEISSKGARELLAKVPRAIDEAKARGYGYMKKFEGIHLHYPVKH